MPANLPTSAIGENTMDVEAADFNGDGHLDIVLAKEWRRNRLLFNDGNGNFTDVSDGNFSSAQHDSEDIAIADFDGNGWLDVVFAAEDDMNHEMYLNTGNGNFSEASDRLPHFISNSVKAFDVNNDGFSDLIFGNAGQNKLFINDGTGNFTDETAIRLPQISNVTQDILLIDAENDGDTDIIAGNEDGNNIWVNNGAGFFSDETADRFPQGTIMETRKVSSADINGDSFPDLFFCNMASSGNPDLKDRLYLNQGNGHFTDVTESHIPSEFKHTFDAVFTDLNNDNAPDLIVGYMQNLLPAVLVNDGNGIFSDQSESYLPNNSSGNNIAVYIADFNGDGTKDLYLGRFQQNDAVFFANPSLSVSENLFREDILIYPNPSTEIVRVINKSSLKIHESCLVDTSGKLIQKFNWENGGDEFTISLKNLTSGVYYLKLNSIKGEFSKTVIKN